MADEDALSKFLKKTGKDAKGMFGGTVGKIFGAAAIAEIATAENKLAAVGRAIKDILLFKPALAAMGIGVFKGMSNAIRTVLKDTGSLDSALRKLSKIQELRTMFTPMVGGAEAAKKKVAELTNFAARFNKTLEETGEAARSLQIMTRGAVDGAGALKLFGDAAAGTNNDLVSVTDTMGEMYAQLRDGKTISGSTEALRQMGVISQGTANELVALQENGASLNTVYEKATEALKEFDGSMDKSRETIEGMNKAQEAAIENLKQNFASPFVADDIQNTKNMTDALEALGPTAQRLGGFFNLLTGGFSTAKSTMASWVATVPALRGALEGLIYVIGILVTAAGVLGSVGLATWLYGLVPAAQAAAMKLAGFSATLATVTSAAATTALVIGSVFAALTAITIVAGVVIQAFHMMGQRADELKKLKEAFDEVNDSMQKQANSMKTLQDRHDALAKAIANHADAQKELNDAIAKGDKGKEEVAKEAVKNADRRIEDITSRPLNELEATDERKWQARSAAEREKRLKDADFDNRMAVASPEERMSLLNQRAFELGEKESRGRDAMADRDKAATDKVLAAEEVAKAQKELEAVKGQAEAAAKRAEEIRKNPRGTGTAAGAAEQLRREKEAELEAQSAAEGIKDAEARLQAAKKAEADIGRGAKGSTGIDYKMREIREGRGELMPGMTKAETLQALEIEKNKALQEEEAYASGESSVAAKEVQAQLDAAREELALNQKLADLDAQRKALKGDSLATTQKDYDLQMEAIDALIEFEKNRKGLKDQAKLSQLQTDRELLERQKKMAEQDFAHNSTMAGIEAERDSMKETGFARTQKQFDLEQRALREQIEYEKNKEGGGDPNEITRLEGRLAASQIDETSARQNQSRNEQAIRADAERLKASLAGDGQKIQELDDYEVFEQKRRQLESSGKSREEAIAGATSFANEAISLSGRNGQSRFADEVAASQLARVGGGGNIERAQNEGLEIQRRQEKLLQQIAKNTEAEGNDLTIKGE